MCLKLLGASSTKCYSKNNFTITSHVHKKRVDADEGIYLRLLRNHLLYYAPTALAEYLTERHLAKRLSDTANKTPEEWKREFSILCAGKCSVKSSQDFEVEKVKIDQKIELFKTPRKERGVPGMFPTVDMIVLKHLEEFVGGKDANFTMDNDKRNRLTQGSCPKYGRDSCRIGMCFPRVFGGTNDK